MKNLEETLAVVGLACRFPGGADTPAAFWQLLAEGRDAIVAVPPTRWSLDAFYDPDPAVTGKMYVREGGFLRESPFDFDAGFFRINHHEALRLDPQQRMILEVAWEALEDAGYPLEKVAGSRTGVYVGVFCLDNKLIHFSEHNHESLNAHTAAAATMAIVANRVSYTFDLRGPSVAMDTACSSSLVAFHLACQALRLGECDVALAGGVNCMLKPEYTISMCKGGYLAPDGRCKTFDARGNGYARGEGAGMIVLKRASQARRDGDLIYALVKATGVNQDGATPGISVPKAEAQIALLQEVYTRAGVAPASVQYVEAHGTGTAVGDPIEARALGTVLATGRRPDRFCRVGSVKTNIGHLEAAAGVAGAMKAILAVHHGAIPPSLHFRTPNPNIDFTGLKLRVQSEFGLWPASDGAPRRAGVNSFGYGGTNAHVLLESESLQSDPGPALSASPADAPGGPLLFPLSARSVPAVQALAARYGAALENSLASASIADVAHTLCRRRTHHERRTAIVAADRAELLAGLLAVSRGEVECGNAPSVPSPGLCFVFTGMGPQWWGMGKELYRESPVFREAIERIDAAFGRVAGFPLLEEFLRDQEQSRVSHTEVSQPLNFALQVALCELLRTRGIVPAAIVGHSVGEVSAAAVAGTLSLEDAVRVSYHRGRLQALAAGTGGMLAVGLSVHQAQAFIQGLEDRVGIGAINSPTSVTLSGEEKVLDSLAEILTGEGLFARKLRVEVPYHSPQMEPLRPELEMVLAGLKPSPPAVPLWSTVTGQRLEGSEHDTAYWWQNVRASVRFADAVTGLLSAGFVHFVEIGPHSVLAAALQECAAPHGAQVLSLPTLLREKPERRTLCTLFSRLFELGYPLNWDALVPPGSRYVRLPTYPWQRQRYWEESENTRRQRLGVAGHPLLGLPMDGPRPTRQVELNRQFFPWLTDHRVDGLMVFPGVGYAEIGLALAGADMGQAVSVEDLEFLRPLLIGEQDPPLAQILHDQRTGEFEVACRTTGSQEGWFTCAVGVVRHTPPGAWKGGGSLQDLKERCRKSWDVGALYDRLAATGIAYGPAFQNLEEVWSGNGEVLARVRGPADDDRHAAAYGLHPALLDVGLQALAAVATDQGLLRPGGKFLPARIGRVTRHGRVAGPCWVHSRLAHVTDSGFRGDIDFVDGDGAPLAALRDVFCTLVASREVATVPWEGLLLEPRWIVEQIAEPAAAGLDGARVLVLAAPQQGEEIAKTLRDRGAERVITASPRDSDPESLLRDSRSTGVNRVVWVAGQEDTAGGAAREAMREANALAALLGALARSAEEPPFVLVATRNVQRLQGDRGLPNLAQAPLWGIARVARLEMATLRLRSLDLPAFDGWDSLAAELARPEDPETEVAVRGEKRWVRRMVRTAATEYQVAWPALRDRADQETFALRNETPGSLDGLRFRRTARQAPGTGEVEVEVRTAPINFKDVMKALGMLSTRVLTPTHFREELGMECGGVIVRVGPGVEGFNVGDRVALSHQGSFRSHLTTAETRYFVKLPESMDFASGSGLITPLLAAWYALVERARLGRGERVLIHSATGGAGLSAIQIARWIGAEIYATAGTHEKREYLRSLGIRHVADSRSLAFADEIREWTGGEGVDVVLNTLAGDGLVKGLRLLRPYGRFVEFGKRDIDADTPLRLSPFNENLDFIAVDFDRLRAERPAECARIMDEVWKGLAAGYFQPLPATVFPLSRVVEAFQHIARAQHIGKVVLSFEDPEVIVHPELGAGARRPLRETWLVTGGLAGFGLAVAQWLVERGVRHLVLLGRRGLATDGAAEAVAVLERAGAHVRVVAGDVANLNDVRGCVDTAAHGLPPLRGVVHAAAVLDDALLASLTAEQLERVMAPKAAGAWNLHESTRELALDAFILFSSVSSMLGNPGQASYAAANAFLDTLALHRRAQGLPALTVDWGVLGETGMVARSQGLQEQLALHGMRALTNAQAFAALGHLLDLDAVLVGVVDADWSRWAATHPGAAGQPVLAALVAEAGETVQSGDTDVGAFLGTLSAPERRQWLEEKILKIVADSMRLPAEKIDPEEPIRNLGLDSLMSVELATLLQRRLGLPVPPMELMAGPSVQQLAERLGARFAEGSEPAPAAGAGA